MHCMCADSNKRPHTGQLCSMVTPLVMRQMDSLRKRENALRLEAQKMKDKLVSMQGYSPFNTMANITGHHDRRGMTTQNEFKLVNVNPEKLRKLSADPIVSVLEMVNKIQLIADLPPQMRKDHRVILVDNFRRELFGGSKQMMNTKSEVVKLLNCSRDLVPIPNTMELTYEKLNYMIEDLHREKGL